MTLAECLPLLSEGRKVRRASWPWPFRLTYKSCNGMKDALQIEPSMTINRHYNIYKEDADANDWEVVE